jgi:putative endonuclease
MDRSKLGRLGEEFAIQYLIDNGYTILSRNQQFNSNHKKLGEIDIIASMYNITYIFEVKTRKSTKYGKAAQSITPKKLETLYIITEFLARSYGSLKIQLIAIDINHSNYDLSIMDLF